MLLAMTLSSDGMQPCTTEAYGSIATDMQGGFLRARITIHAESMFVASNGVHGTRPSPMQELLASTSKLRSTAARD
jgi:hypothetical protein